MKLELTFPALNGVIRAIEATERPWTAPSAEQAEFARIGCVLETKGIEVSLEDLETTDGLFTYKGHHVVLYIKDMTMRPDVLDDPSAGNKIHTGDCQTIRRMKGEGRFARYIATTRIDDRYDATIIDREGAEREAEVRLHPCRNCLRDIDYRNWATANQDAIVRGFRLREFFDAYASRFEARPRHTDKTVGSTGYTKDWPEVSRKTRQRVLWLCQDCKADLTSHPHLLDVHHVNGVKSDNDRRNLRALCKLCHADQPHHAHMRRIITEGQRRTIEQLRNW